MIVQVGADWKDYMGFIDSLEEQLKEFGLYLYDDPTCDGTDWVGMLISDKELTEKDLKQYKKDFEKEIE